MTEKALKAMFRRLGSEGESEGNTNKVESIRFRSASRPDIKTSKKVAVIKRMYHEERKNINAYIRFSTKEEAVKCCQANGTKVDGHVLRVDLALNSQTHETNKAVFLGNLAFTTHEDDVRAVFEKCGPIEDVRLVRDSNTGIGRGIGYVNFTDKDSVETALKLNGTQVCGRSVRVSRSVRKPKKDKQVEKQKQQPNNKSSRRPSGHTNHHNKNTDDQKPTFQQKFDHRKTKFSEKNQNKVWRKKKGSAKADGEEAGTAKSFQGVATSQAKPVKQRLSKQEKHKKFIAKKLMG